MGNVKFNYQYSTAAAQSLDYQSLDQPTKNVLQAFDPTKDDFTFTPADLKKLNHPTKLQVYRLFQRAVVSGNDDKTVSSCALFEPIQNALIPSYDFSDALQKSLSPSDMANIGEIFTVVIQILSGVLARHPEWPNPMAPSCWPNKAYNNVMNIQFSANIHGDLQSISREALGDPSLTVPNIDADAYTAIFVAGPGQSNGLVTTFIDAHIFDGAEAKEAIFKLYAIFAHEYIGHGFSFLSDEMKQRGWSGRDVSIEEEIAAYEKTCQFLKLTEQELSQMSEMQAYLPELRKVIQTEEQLLAQYKRKAESD